ncbi:DUF262 domain-containing protein [Shewanella oncorhynchi]|uniref:DUF262 domain-containing protein n=1 Tax=Shewanella oncorhynchi TaxID=2726434 RepID=UPI003D7C08A3
MPDNQVVDSHLCLKSVYELLDQHFHIPAYQRGYRWTEIQVRELLDDIWEFIQETSDEKSAFYCLQPIVVVKRNHQWELVDGQQRLTTLYIILHYLEKEHLRRKLTEAYKKSLYSMEYETRAESSAFLRDILPAAETDNIDFYHMAKAYEVVTDWFRDRDYNDNNQLLGTLLAKPDSGQSVKVIWYDLSDECIDNDYAVDVFSRINIGKIPLTNAELVKALLLQRSHFEQGQASLKQIQIASEWDIIEKQLHQSDFWYFIYNADSYRKYETRIEYIFDLMKSKKPGDEPYFTFHQFNSALKQGQTDIESLWKEIQDYFLTFDEWFRDRELYHLIGFLVDCGRSVARLKTFAEQNCTTKTSFKAYLKDEIRKEVRCQLSELTYGDPSIKKVLLLFNIQTLLATKEADVRFPFDRYKNERWNIEHIQSQTNTELSGSDRDAWIDDMHEYFNSPHLDEDPKVNRFIKQINQLKEQTQVDDNKFSVLYNELCTYFVGEDQEISWLHDIGNLALLDVTTNCSYKNALFPVKRLRIIRNDMRGVFVPICTKNAFLKFYSRSSTDLIYWRKADADDYTRAVAEVLSDYLPEQGGVDE